MMLRVRHIPIKFNPRIIRKNFSLSSKVQQSLTKLSNEKRTEINEKLDRLFSDTRLSPKKSKKKKKSELETTNEPVDETNFSVLNEKRTEINEKLKRFFPTTGSSSKKSKEEKQTELETTNEPVDETNFSVLKKIIKRNAEQPKYVDMSGIIDVSESNENLVTMIKDSSDKINKDRYETPSRAWSKNFTKSQLKDLRQVFKALPKNAKVTGLSMSNAISVGDLVTLGTDNFRLYLVVGTPKTFGSRICTVLSDRGEVIFTALHTIGYRFSGVIPDRIHPLLEKFVVLEEKHLDTVPVGVPDASFSRSNAAFPKEMQQGNADDTTKVSEAEESEYQTDNLIVQQASSQLLTNTDVQTFFVPKNARKLYARALLDITNQSFDAFGTMSMVLERAHRDLQRDDNGVFNTPRTISIFEILYHLTNSRRVPTPASKLGKPISKCIDFDKQEYSIHHVLSLLASLKRQSNLWKIVSSKALFTPTKVRIMCLSQVSERDRMLEYITLNKGFNEAASNFEKTMTEQGADPTSMQLLQDLIRTMKDYINDRFTNDDSMTTNIVALLRKFESISKRLGMNHQEAYKNEYSYGRAYDMLTKLNQNRNFNPILWSRETDLLGKAPSVNTSVKEKFYNYLNDDFFDQKDQFSVATKETNFYDADPLKEIRVDMRDVPVYCIDEPTAHEIDDGISIEEVEDDYVVSIHVAEPTSYIKPDSVLSEIAFEKTSTTYFPDEAFPMLPKMISDLAGLGIPDKDTRTFVVQYRLKKKLLDEFIQKRLEDETYEATPNMLQEVQNQIDSKGKILFATAKNFRQGFTYDRVNEVLSQASLLEQFKKKRQTEDSDFNNLIKLQHISLLLLAVRESNDALVFEQNSKLYVPKSEEINKESSFQKTGDLLEIKLMNSDDMIRTSASQEIGASTRLVTENMIIANYLTAKFASDNGIQILYRYLDPNFNKELLQEYKSFPKNKDSLAAHQFMQLFSLVTKAEISEKPKRHFLMGLSMYSTITSPLRRYMDMVNQWKIQDHFLGRVTIEDKTLSGIVSHLNAQADVIRTILYKASSFWQGLFLRTYWEQVKAGKVTDPIDFKLQLLSSPTKGTTVHASMPEFKFIRAHIEISQALLDDVKSGELEVGGNIDSNKLRLKQVDFMENEVIFEYV